MKSKQNTDKLIEEAMSSIDNISRAEAKPYLLTRINARMNKLKGSAWEKAGWFIARPAVALTGLCLILVINAAVVVVNRTSENAAAAEQVQTDEFSYTVATIYDNENNQP
jgi:hypothetical protein